MTDHLKKYYIPLISRMYAIAPVSLVLTAAGKLFEAVFPACTTIVLARLTEAVSAQLGGMDNRKGILLTGGILIFVYLLQQALQLVMSVTVNASVYEKCISGLKMEIARKASRIALVGYEDSKASDMYARAEECLGREIPGGIFMSLVAVVMNLIGVLAVIGVLAGYSLWFLPVSIVSVLPFYIARKLRGEEFYRLKKKQTKDNRMQQYLWGLFAQKESIREMRLMCAEDYIAGKWTDKRDRVNEELWKHNRKEAGSMLFCDGVRVTGYLGSILIAVLLFLRGAITIGPFAACLTAFLAVQNAAKEFLVRLGDLHNDGAFLKDYFDFMDMAEEKETLRVSGSETEDIRLQHVTFSYPNADNIAIKDVSLSVGRGEKIAIVGLNGSGKTTLCKLMLGMYPPRSGEVFQSERVHGSCGIVSQNFIRYRLTLRENIGISNPAGMENQDAIREVIRKTGIPELIGKHENIDYRLGVEFGGADLSGGQWQKAAIARAVYGDAALYILDEPTSALDPLAELSVMNSFLEMAADKTAVMVLHRMGLCKSVDRVIVMKDGEIAEAGSHAELMEKKGEYYRLYQEQAKWYQA